MGLIMNKTQHLMLSFDHAEHHDAESMHKDHKKFELLLIITFLQLIWLIYISWLYTYPAILMMSLQ